MSKHLKRVLALLLALVMVIGLLPTIAFAAEEKKASLDIWTQIEALRDGVQKKDGSADYSDYVSISDDVYDLVESSAAAAPAWFSDRPLPPASNSPGQRGHSRGRTYQNP